MTILNDGYNFATDAGHSIRVAFRGEPRRVVLQAGESLYRFASLPTPDGTFPGSQMFLSPWWFPSSTFHALCRISTRTGTSLADAGRSRLAVAQEWNPSMDKMIVIQFRAPVYGWLGPAAHQPGAGGDRSVLLPGNFDQVFVPNLASDAAGLSSRVAFLAYHGSVE